MGSPAALRMSRVRRATPRGLVPPPPPERERAPAVLSAYVPQPIKGESPTRPGGLPVIPPVEVAAATRPRRSRATAPTVPPITLSSLRRCASVISSSGSQKAMPSSRARAMAPSPTKNEWRSASRMRRASVIGWRMLVTQATAPFRRVSPSMIDASISTVPSEVSTEPRPALKRGLSSMAATAASTASTALPPSRSRAHPADTASRIPCRSSSRANSGSAPAPPWMRRAGTRLVISWTAVRVVACPELSIGYAPGGHGQVEDRAPRRARPPHRHVPALSPSRQASRGGGGRAPAALSRPALLGASASGLRRSKGARPHRGPRSRRSRRQPDGAHVHGGPQRRLALSRAARGRPRQPAYVDASRRRAPAHRRLHHGDPALRPSRQQALARRDGALPALLARRAQPPHGSAGRGGAGQDRLGRVPARSTCHGAGRAPSAPAVRPRRARRHARRRDPPRELPPEPAEHLHGQADAPDAEGRLRAGKPARR